jgi:Bacterial regulatory proteins, gntR family
MVAMAARRSELDRADERPIDPAHPRAVYVQLKSLLLEEILSGTYGADGQLPTEHELCAVHGISLSPVHRARASAFVLLNRHYVRGLFAGATKG